MNEDACTITIDGHRAGTYYINCDAAKYINNHGVNTGGSNYTGYSFIRNGNNDNYTLTFNSLSYPSYRSGNNTIYVTDINSVTWNYRGNYFREHDLVVLVCLAILVVSRIIPVFGRN